MNEGNIQFIHHDQYVIVLVLGELLKWCCGGDPKLSFYGSFNTRNHGSNDLAGL